MDSLLKILAYLLGTLFLGCLLAPPLHWAGHAVGAHVHSARWLQEVSFQRYFDRAMLLAALLLLWPTVHALRISGWRDLALQPDPRWTRHLLLGFVAAGGLLWLLGLALWSAGIYVPRIAAPWAALGSALLTAAAVAALEEGFFRGALLGLVMRGARRTTAVVFVSTLFALLHFLKPQEHAVGAGEIGYLSGFVLLPHSFWQFGDPLLVAGGFTTLFCVGMILAWARLATCSLWLPIGLHAGWIFGLKTFSALSRHRAPRSLWFGDSLLIGLGSVGVVLLTGGLVWWALRRETGGGPGPTPAAVELPL